VSLESLSSLPETSSDKFIRHMAGPELSRTLANSKSDKESARDGEHFIRGIVHCLEVIKMAPTNESKKIRLRNGDRAEPVEIWKARKFIEEHASEELSLNKVARAVGISGNHLSEKFKSVTGINFVEYVARVRFENACDLLKIGERRISEIAFAVGFQSLSQFNRVFRRFSDKSPTAYRQALMKR